MIREERDPTFWDAVAQHPEVRAGALLGLPLSLAEVVQNPSVTPLAAEHGGYLFCRLDWGRVYELHSLFTPEGWGREALVAAKQSLALMWDRGMQVLTTYEVEGNWRSRPPLSFGFQPAGDFAPAFGCSLKTWILTRAAYERKRT